MWILAIYTMYMLYIDISNSFTLQLNIYSVMWFQSFLERESKELSTII